MSLLDVTPRGLLLLWGGSLNHVYTPKYTCSSCSWPRLNGFDFAPVSHHHPKSTTDPRCCTCDVAKQQHTRLGGRDPIPSAPHSPLPLPLMLNVTVAALWPIPLAQPRSGWRPCQIDSCSESSAEHGVGSAPQRLPLTWLFTGYPSFAQ